MDVVLQRWSF